MKQYSVYYEARYWDEDDKMDRFTCGFIFAETLAEAGRWAGEYFKDLITVAFTPLDDGPLRVNRELADKILKFDGEDAPYSAKML
jgi:hypothetical protein